PRGHRRVAGGPPAAYNARSAGPDAGRERPNRRVADPRRADPGRRGRRGGGAARAPPGGHRHGTGRGDPDRALPRGRPQDGRELRRARRARLLRRAHVPPRRARIRGPGRRPEGGRQRRPRVPAEGRVQPAPSRPGDGRDGAQPGSGLGGQPVLRLLRPPAAPRRAVHGLRAGGRGHGRGRPHPARRPDADDPHRAAPVLAGARPAAPGAPGPAPAGRGVVLESATMSETVASALWLSLRVSLVATLVDAAIGIPLAYLLARRRFWGRQALDLVVTLPLVLPPTV